MTEIINPLIGAWMLVSVETQLGDGQVIRAFGEEPKGIIVYTSSGHMSAQLSNPDRLKVASNDQQKSTAEEALSNFERYIAYHGTYELNVNDGTVTHFVDGSMFPNWEGDSQLRFFEINGNRITLSTPEVQWGDLGTVKTTLVWEKLD